MKVIDKLGKTHAVTLVLSILPGGKTVKGHRGCRFALGSDYKNSAEKKSERFPAVSLQAMDV